MNHSSNLLRHKYVDQKYQLKMEREKDLRVDLKQFIGKIQLCIWYLRILQSALIIHLATWSYIQQLFPSMFYIFLHYFSILPGDVGLISFNINTCWTWWFLGSEVCFRWGTVSFSALSFQCLIQNTYS